MIFDISQEVFSCKVFPGDPAPAFQRILNIEQGDICNLTAFSMCAHNGTHVDAPFHFVPDGNAIEKIGMETFVGDCYVSRFEGDLTSNDAAGILEKAKSASASERILIAGKATVTLEAARVFAQSKIKLLGNESQTVGPEDAPMEVHKILLGADCLNALGTDQEAAATTNLLAESEEDIMPIDGLIAFADSETGLQVFGKDKAASILSHAKEIKASGSIYCDCPACSAALAIKNMLK